MATISAFILVLPILSAALVCEHLPFILPSDRIYVSGTHMIGALLPLSNLNPETGLCNGPLDISGIRSVEFIELLLHLIELVNTDSSFLPKGVTIGIVIYDDYRSILFTPSQAAKFLSHCEANSHLVAVLCCNSLSRTNSVINILQSHKMAVVNFETLLSIPEDASQSYYFHFSYQSDDKIQVIAALLDHFNWTYVSVIYTVEEYGTRAFEILESLLQNRSICVAYAASYSNQMQRIIRNIDSVSDKTSVIVLLLSTTLDLNPLLQALSESKNTYVLLSLEYAYFSKIMHKRGWRHVIIALDDLVQTSSSIRIILQQRMMRDTTKQANPWLSLYRKSCFCRWFPENSTCSVALSKSSMAACASHFALNFLNDSFWKVVEAIRANYMDENNLSTNASTTSTFNNLMFVNALSSKNQRTKVLNNFAIVQVYFDQQQQLMNPIGYWNASEKRVTVNAERIMWPNVSTPRATCASPCTAREAKVMDEVPCCWKCIQCLDHQIPVDESCESCLFGWWPVQSECLPLTPNSLTSTSPIGVTIIGTAIAGIFLTTVVVAILVRHRYHPCIMSSCRDVSAAAMIGIVALFQVPLVFLADLTMTACIWRRFLLHVPFTMVYAPTLVKCAKIHSLFVVKQRSNHQPRFLGLPAQLIVVLITVSLEVGMVSLSLLTCPAGTEDLMPSIFEPLLERVCVECLGSFMPPAAVNMLLMISSSVLAFRCRKVAPNPSESKQIAFGVAIAAVLYGVFITVYWITTRDEHRITMLYLNTVSSAVTALVSLFLFKVIGIYIPTDNLSAD